MSALRAEWTKFRTVPGLVLGLVVAVLAVVGLGLGPSRTGSCGTNGPASDCTPTVGPDGEAVSARFTFVHKGLTGDGSITARVASFTGVVPVQPSGPDDRPTSRSGVAPWAKAGLVLAAGTRPGSAYAAVLVTGAHGVRMQYDYTHDLAGPPGGAPRWLRLTRTGDTVTGSASADGLQWTVVGTARLAGLPVTVPAGVFVTSPQATGAVTYLGMTGDWSGPTRASATFDPPAVTGAWDPDRWTAEEVGGTVAPQQLDAPGTVTGAGDLAPMVEGAAGLGVTVTQTLVGTFAGLLAVVVIGALFVTAEYRRGLIRVTLAATPDRGRVLAAKAVVLGAVTFVAGLVGAALVVAYGPDMLRANGVYVHPVGFGTDVRLVAGTAAVLALSAVLALGLGTALRRGTAAVTIAAGVVVLPYILVQSVLPVGAAQWVLRVTPAAALAVQQTAVVYPQVDNVTTPADGYYPLGPWAGLAVLGAWTAAALGLGYLALRRRDA